MQTIKSLLMFQPTKMIPNLLPNIGSYNPIPERCNLCLAKKLEVIDDQNKNLLNKIRNYFTLPPLE